jgi:transcriptional regulator with XRE-family HTH domain
VTDHEQKPAEQVVERGFTARLEQLRSDAGQPTLETIARHSGRSIGAVSNTFTGKAVPSNATAKRIVTALGATFDDEWLGLLDEARAERDRKRQDDEPEPVPEPDGKRPRRRTVLIAGIVALVVVAGAAVAFLPDWNGVAGRSGSGGVGPVVVTQAGPLGLIVRSSATRDGEQIGSAAEGQTLWAECRAVTDFDPRPDTGKGPVWYRVRWPSPGPTKDFLSSTPEDEYTGWVYGGFAVPRAPETAPIPQC